MTGKNPMQALYSKLGAVGVAKKFAQGLLPEWWDDAVAETPSGLLQAQIILAKSLNFDLETIRDPAAPIQFRHAARKFKHSKAVDKKSIQLSAEFSTALARITSQAMVRKYIPPPPNALSVRERILQEKKCVDLEALLEYCESIGVTVLHIGTLPGKKMDAVATMQDGRAAIVLCRNDNSARLLFHLAHELGHIAMGHLGQDDSMLIDEKIVDGDEDKDEKEADSFAICLLNGSQVKYKSNNKYMTAETLAASAANLGKKERIDPGHIVLNYAHESKNFGLANKALAVLGVAPNGATLVNARLIAGVDFDKLSDDQAALIQRSLTAVA